MDIWQILMTPFSLLLRFFCETFNSYGVALILFTIVVKVILFPLSLKGKKSMIKMTMVNSQVQEIQKRCGNDRERYNQELQKFYQENNVDPMGGCGWSMIPLFILWPLYAIIRRPLKYLMHLTEDATIAVANALNWTASMGTEFRPIGTSELVLASKINAGNLTTAATAAGASTTGLFGMFVINFMFLGIDLSQVPNWQIWTTDLSWNSIGLFLLPLISAGMSFLSMQVTQRTNQMNKNQAQNQQSNMMMYLMGPLLSLWIGYTLPAGMCIYWISNSILMMLQEIIAGKMLKKDYEAAQKEMEEQQRKSKEAEKERRRKAAERKAAAIAAGSKKQPKKEKTGPDVSASREGIRAYARGRAYDPNRYPITPYHDPNGPDKEEEAPAELTDEEKTLLAEKPVEQATPVEPPEVQPVPEAPAAQEQPAGEEDGFEEAYAPEDEEQ